MAARKKKSNFSAEKKKGLHGWFSRNNGKGWIDCKTGKTCGRKSAKGGSKRSYPACRPTKSQCTSAASRKKSSKRISWQGKKRKKK